MPAPIVLAGVVLAVLALGSAAAWSVIRILANKKLSLLGAQRVGKTTLFQTLRDGKPPESSTATVDAEPGTEFVLRLKKKDVRFEIPKDLPGNDGLAYPAWQKAFATSDYVWYLFRADLIAEADKSTIEIVKGHLNLLDMWRKQHGGSRPKILLVGTFADKNPGFPKNLEQIQALVNDSPPIKAGRVKLEAGLVVGSMANAALARKLLKSIVSEMT